jgi:hypothetical protein
MTKGVVILRNVDPGLWAEIKKLAIDEGISANQFVIELLSEAVDRAKARKGERDYDMIMTSRMTK